MIISKENGLWFVLALLFALAAPVWFFYGAPLFNRMPEYFHYEARVLSSDNFYDEAARQFSGEVRSATTWTFFVESVDDDGVLLIGNDFSVENEANEKIISLHRTYAIDPVTGEHVPGRGDENRTGYLFAPAGIRKDQTFTYWHTNYNAPAVMTFAGEELIEGLRVYRFETR